MGSCEKQVREVVNSFKVNGKLPESVIIPECTEIVFSYNFGNGVIAPRKITTDKELRVEAILSESDNPELFVVWNRHEDYKGENENRSDL